MTLSSGTKLGPYEIVSRLGAGGMGEVYKARDTRLDRSVAIKVLSSHLSGDPELRERFEREARAVSSLNHPHICTLHDVGSENGVDFLVMEHIEGETLAARLERGALPLSEALAIAVEVAGALDKAHRVGIVHRDLKPGNIMLTKSGPKLLDFGLAKVAGTSTRVPDLSTLSALPTEQKSLTAAGTVLGTFQYMAPEQLEGREIDARTDIFALGAVIYEMLTGNKAFDGKTQASLISAIMTSEPPPISAVAPISPPSLEHVVKTCMAKDPERRWQSAADVARELEWIAEGGPQASVGSPAAQRRARTTWGAIGLVAGILATAIVSFFFLREPPVPKLVTRFTLDLSSGQTWLPTYVAIAPDSSRVAYVAGDDSGQYLYIRRMGEVEPTQVAGTLGAGSPFFSPDGQWVGFWADGKLQRVSVTGGLPITLCDTPAIRAASWGEDGEIVFGSNTASGLGLSSVPMGGGTPTKLTELRTEPGEVSHRVPDILPGGRAVLFTIIGNSGSSIALLMRDTGEIRTLIEDAAGARYAATGHLVYTQGSQLLAVPFDLDRLEVTGAPVPLVEGVQASQFAVSADGSLFYGEGASLAVAPEVNVVWVDRHGVASPLTDKPGTIVEPSLSPDGRRVALTVADDQSIDIWALELSRGTLTRLTFEESNDSLPLWSPDGKVVSFSSDRAGGWNVFAVPSDGSGEPTPITTSDLPTTATSWSPDGKLLALQQQKPDRGLDIGIFSIEQGTEEVFLSTPFNEFQAVFSPDGRWLAYTSNESGREEVYVRAFPGPGGKWQISTEGGSHPLWSPKGNELFYRNEDRMMAVPISINGGELVAGDVASLFDGNFRKAPFSVQEHLYFDVSRDGQRFLMLKPVDREATPTTLTVVLNWYEELKARVPIN